MPLYDVMLMFKPHFKKEVIMDIVARVGKQVQRRNGVLTEVKSFGKVQLGYGIKKLDGRYFQGQLIQLSMMVTPDFNKELLYLNKEDRLLRWLLVKHRDTNYGLEFISEDDIKGDLSKIRRNNYDEEEIDDDSDDDDEYEVDQEEKTNV